KISAERAPAAGATSHGASAAAPSHPVPPETRPPIPTTPASDAPPIPGLAAGDLEAFYARFVQAHQTASGAPPKATLEQMRAKLQNELPKLLGEKGGRVVLDVEVEGGKVRLKARQVR